MPFKTRQDKILAGLPGSLATIQRLEYRTMNPSQIKAGEEIPFGSFIVYDSTTKTVRLPSASTDKLIGVAAMPATWTSLKSDSPFAYKEDDFVVWTAVNDIWVLAAKDVESYVNVNVTTTGTKGVITDSITDTIATNAYAFGGMSVYESQKIVKIAFGH